RLGLVVGDLGKDTARDATGLAGRASQSDQLREAEREQGLPQPSGGRKEYQVGAVLVVHLAFLTYLAQSECREGTYGKRKLSPFAKALRTLIQAPTTPADHPACV